MDLPLQHYIERDGFRLRGLEVSRIDAFSDVVFGFALTLLVVSLEVPKTFGELHATLRGFFPFAISFLFLMMVWYGHYRFFRRFGLHDLGTVVINAALLFVVLYFVYPLKFLFTFLISGLGGHWNGFFASYNELQELMVLYGVGFSTIYLLMAALYGNGYRQREILGLSPLERLLARGYITESIGVACIGVLSCVVALLLPARLSGLAGWVYMLISVFKAVYGRRSRGQIARLKAIAGAPPQTGAEVTES